VAWHRGPLGLQQKQTTGVCESCMHETGWVAEGAIAWYCTFFEGGAWLHQGARHRGRDENNKRATITRGEEEGTMIRVFLCWVVQEEVGAREA